MIDHQLALLLWQVSKQIMGKVRISKQGLKLKKKKKLLGDDTFKIVLMQ